MKLCLIGSCRSLSKAEIHFYSSNPRILPSTVYLSRQMNFHSARPRDEDDMSIVDDESRVGPLQFRSEVFARSTSPAAQPFDEPLGSALHSIIESRPMMQWPGLPNGYPQSTGWKAIPIHQISAGLSEGMGKVKREYLRSHQSLSRRRISEGNQDHVASVSFEDDAVFASAAPGDEDPESSPSSVAMPASDLSTAGDSDDVEWGEGWEEEYRRAVEEDGGPEELVLGLMDEEEEDRRKWEERLKMLSKRYAG